MEARFLVLKSLDVLLLLSDVVVIPEVDYCVHSEHILLRKDLQLGRPWSSGNTLDCCKSQTKCIEDKDPVSTVK